MTADGKKRQISQARASAESSIAASPAAVSAANGEHEGIDPAELRQLKESLREAQETIEAIRSGEVDALVVRNAGGHKVYSLTGAEQPYRVYVERMQEGAVTVAADALILYCNQRFADMLQQPLERVISSDIRQYFPPQAWRAISGVFAGSREVVKHESALKRLEPSEPLVVNLAASRLPLEGQDVVCLVVTDLTEQKEKAELRLAKKVAEKASHAKDAFLAALSHELRTPLTPALMAAVALENDFTLTERVRKEVGMIRRNVELEARLIDDLLDLTRIARGKLELQTGPTDMHTVIHRAVEICLSDFEAKNIQLTTRLDAARVFTKADAVRMQQVFWNLLRNAAKFTPNGGFVSIRTWGASADDTFWAVVEDTGIGFAPDSAPKLFNAFEQGGRHITRQFGGLGLGLAISRSIVELHGGTLAADSEGEGKGARFTVRLPLRRVERPRLATGTSSPFDPRKNAGLRILLVEDHKDTRTSMEIFLRKQRHDVKTAANAREACDLADRHTFDLVISDLGLPDETGLELMKKLRARHGLRGIATSGYGMEEDIAQSRAAGFTHHLTKPISLDRLKAALAEIAAWPSQPSPSPQP
jgi:signal transduction histidine kinase/ActR/RegA family two-component response regulator